MSTATIPAQPTVRALFDRAAAIRDYEVKMIAAVRQYEEKKADYEAVQAAYLRPGRKSWVAKVRASGDQRSSDAGRYAEWFRAEALMYAAVASELRAGALMYPAERP